MGPLRLAHIVAPAPRRARSPERSKGEVGRRLRDTNLRVASREEERMTVTANVGGRPTEQSAPVTRTLHFRLTEAEHDRLQILARALGVPPSRLLRRAVREMVNGGPDLFDDGVAAMSEVARQLAAVARRLDGAAANSEAAGLEDVRRSLEDVRRRFADLVRASRERWVAAKADVAVPRRTSAERKTP